MNTHLLFSPQLLNLPALPDHFPLVILSALFYQAVYTFAGPLLHSAIKPHTVDTPAAKLARYFWIDTLVSFTQSYVNTCVAIYLLTHTEFRGYLTPEERILGYHQETARGLAVATGYFCYHLWETWVNRRVYGLSMFLHAVCALFTVSLGFRPQGLHYTATFLIWELPNLFLNIQRYLDRSGRRQTSVRAINRLFLLSTYVTLRLAFGTLSLIQMGKDMLITSQFQHPRIRAEHVLPSIRSGELIQEITQMRWFLAFVQLGSLTFLNMQGFYWFTKIMAKGDLQAKTV
ncbi:TLC domain-containing protein [Calycina marina]|uniref:TLC domain-containing protein n=1 Tax=Calycina marina TaxID=1763456 RepID=A0A9P7YVM0_9HELO|nr:TLC domain-containing protein [Calycina marina]